MTQITASMIQTLRQKTQAGMLICRNALQEAQGDMDKAMEIVAKQGHLKANKAATRVAAEGAVFFIMNESKEKAILLEVNCETDFVAKDSSFLAFGQKVAEYALKQKAQDVEVLKEAMLEDGQTIEHHRASLSGRLGENVQLRRMMSWSVEQGHILGYLHLNQRIGVMVQYVGDETVAKDVALQVTAMNPECLVAQDIQPARLEEMKRLFEAQSEGLNKPAAALEKIIQGRLEKWRSEVCLLDQVFFKDGQKTVRQFIQSHQTEILRFVRFQVGEGIEKADKPSFAEEVKAQASRGA